MRKLFITAAAALLSLAAHAEAIDYQWSDGNSRVPSIYYGEPETDNIWFSASCTRKGVVQLMFTLDRKFATKIAPNAKQVYAEVSVGNDRYRLIGEMEPNDMNDTHDLIVFQTPDNRLLQRLAADDREKFKFGTAVLPLNKKSAAGFQRVLKNCD